MKVKVLEQFRDKFTGKLYQPDTEIEIEDEARANDLVERKLAKVVSEPEKSNLISVFGAEFEKKAVVEALKSVGAKVNANFGEQKLAECIAALGTEELEQVKSALGVEE